MTDRSHSIILLGILFFFIGGAAVYVLVENDNPHETACRERGGVPVQGSGHEDNVVCLDPSVLR
jgi:hypothetical protein